MIEISRLNDGKEPKVFTLWHAGGYTSLHNCGHLDKWWVIDRGCCLCRGYGKLVGNNQCEDCEICQYRKEE